MPKRSGTWYLRSQGKHCGPNLSASMKNPDTESRLPSCPLPETDMPTFIPQNDRCFVSPSVGPAPPPLLTMGGCSVSSRTFWFSNLRASWNLLSRAGERASTSPKIMWLCRKSLWREKRPTHTPQGSGVPSSNSSSCVGHPDSWEKPLLLRIYRE